MISVFALTLLFAVATQAPPPPPDFLDRKPPAPKEILDNKSEGWYVTGIPMIGVDPEVGAVLGAQAQIFDNGPKSSPFFAYSPYRHQIYVGAQTTVEGNFKTAFFAYDQPYIDDTPWRIRSYVGYTQNKFRNYFGTGEETLAHLRYPGSPREFDDLSDFKHAIDDKPGGITWSDYVSYHQRTAVGAVNLEYDLAGGLLRPLVGIQFGRVGVTDYTGRLDGNAVQQETKLAEDDRLGRILGIDGGWDNSIRVGLAFDSRDYEPDPTSGLLAQAFVTEAIQALGSEFNYGQATIGFTGFTPVFATTKSVVAVGNFIYALRWGDTPFYAMNRLALPKDEVNTGLGGFPTMRGYSSYRFVGRTTIDANAELRWSFADFTVLEQHLKTTVAAFVDTGRVFDSAWHYSIRDWKSSWGIGLRLAWNLATIISFDYGVSPEGALFFMELGHPF